MQRHRTILLAALLAALLLLAPFLNVVLRVPGLVPKILLSVVGGLIANTVATLAFASLAEGWFLASKGDGKAVGRGLPQAAATSQRSSATSSPRARHAPTETSTDTAAPRHLWRGS